MDGGRTEAAGAGAARLERAVVSILHRDVELGRIEAGVGAAVMGRGGLLLFVGPAGIGKTSLVRAARTSAHAAGARVLSAAASPLDRDYAFGLLHQLLDAPVAEAGAEQRERLFSGTAARGRAVLAPAEEIELPTDPGHAVLHGLFWLIANLADERPLVLLVDDLHWADRASLRLLEYLTRRLEELPVLVVATMRPNEPGAEADLLLALETAVAAEVVRPRALDAAAAAELLEGALEAAPDAAFISAVLEATGGNPLLLRTLAAQAADSGLAGNPEDAAEVTRLAAVELGVVVRRRLHSLGADAVALAHAAAVLGEPARLDDLSAVAELDRERGQAAADRLVAAELLEAPAWRFVHPIVRDAVADALAPGQRAGLHTRAAQQLRATGAPTGRIAVHLLASEPAGDPSVVADLRAAAHAAAAEGAPEAGVVHLRRALDEPPPPEERAHLLLELGELEARAGDPAAAERLGAALDAGLTGDDAARARSARAGLALLAQPEPATAELERALADARDPALRLRIEAFLLESLGLSIAGVPRRRELVAAGREDPDASVVMAAVLAHESGNGGGPAAETVAFAQRATAGTELLDVVGPGTPTFILMIHGVRYAEARELSRALIEEGERAARRLGLSVSAAPFLEHTWAYWHLSFGSVATGLAQAEVGLDRVRAAGWDVMDAAFAGVTAELLLEQDRLDDAARVADDVDPQAVEGTLAGPFLLTPRGVARWRQHRLDEAESDLRRAIAQLDARGYHSPFTAGARLHLGRLLAERGRTDEALEIADACAKTARAAGLDGALGASLRVRGLALGGDEGIEQLSEAVEHLGRSPLELEHAWALHDLGGALRRSGRRADARGPLREAIDLAARHEAVHLARVARDELVATGTRVGRESLTGPASLTPSERRVADLAADGLSNREIAETLWVTRKTVELHLGRAYTKLGIRSRAQLADALGAPAAGR